MYISEASTFFNVGGSTLPCSSCITIGVGSTVGDAFGVDT